MSISLGTLSFGVEADTSKLDKGIEKSEKKISRFSLMGIRSFNSLNSFNVNRAEKQIDSYSNKLEKMKSQSQKTMNEIQNLEHQMNKIKERIGETSGLNLQFEQSQNLPNRMTTNEYSNKLDKLALEDKQYQKLLDKQIKLVEKSEEQGIEIDKVNSKLTTTNQKMNEAKKVQSLNNSFEGIGSRVKQVISGIGSAIKRSIKWGVTILGIGTALGAIRKGINSYLESNPQIKANLDYMVYAIGQALALAILWVINLLQNLLGIIGAIAQVLFGVNLFANSFSKYMSKANKSASGVKKSLGSLAGFDEINNIGNQDSSAAGGGSSIGVPDMDLENKTSEWIPAIQRIKELFDDWKWAILGVAAALATIKILSLFGASGTLIAGVVLIFSGLGLVVQGLINMFTGDFATGMTQFLIGLGLIALGVLILFGGFPALIVLIVGLVVALVAVVIKYWDQIKEWCIKAFNTIVDFFKNNWQGILLFIINPIAGAFKLAYDNCEGFRNFVNNVVTAIKNWFIDLGTNIKNAFVNAINWVKTSFDNFKSWISEKVKNIGTFFTNLWAGVKNSFKSCWEWILGVFSKGRSNV